MTIAVRGLKVKVKVMGQANAVSPTSMKGGFSSWLMCKAEYLLKCFMAVFSRIDFHVLVEALEMLPQLDLARNLLIVNSVREVFLLIWSVILSVS